MFAIYFSQDKGWPESGGRQTHDFANLQPRIMYKCLLWALCGDFTQANIIGNLVFDANTESTLQKIA